MSVPASPGPVKRGQPIEGFSFTSSQLERLTDRLINGHHHPLKTTLTCNTMNCRSGYNLILTQTSFLKCTVYHEHVMHCFCQTQSRTMQRVKGIKLWVSSFRSDLFGTMMWVHNMFEKVHLTCPRSLDKIICSLGMFALWITFMWVCWRRRRRWGGVKWYWIIYGCQKTSSNPWTLIPPPQTVLYLGLQTKILSCNLSISLPICLATSRPM